jgi:hypothetical protein
LSYFKSAHIHLDIDLYLFTWVTEPNNDQL